MCRVRALVLHSSLTFGHGRGKLESGFEESRVCRHGGLGDSHKFFDTAVSVRVVEFNEKITETERTHRAKLLFELSSCGVSKLL